MKLSKLLKKNSFDEEKVKELNKIIELGQLTQGKASWKSLQKAVKKGEK